MPTFQPVPTYADPVEVDPKTGKSGFNPTWLSWFLTLTQGGLGAATAHDSLAGLQGGTAGQFFHLTLAEYQHIYLRNLIPPFSITVATSPSFTYQNTNPYDVDVICTGGTGVQLWFSRDNITLYTLGAVVEGMFRLSPGDYFIVAYVFAPTLTGVSR